jgi:hypothetical protein
MKEAMDMINLKNKINRFDQLMAAVTFGEAGEFDTAQTMMNQKLRKKNRKRACSKLGRRASKRPRLRV